MVANMLDELLCMSIQWIQSLRVGKIENFSHRC